ncbi:tRNA G18 (ribose-2'-O)-methylase SpoU [Constrictibacter sp. MBR-5]|jgi:tRNA G18 (ribose-2'-O)-methylase SpoU|uniref:RNA methyltransferase n=1 Tax=Constrictibacter sp. MBR-5 TaxID=3156467 RepID=UPI003396B4EA
MRGYFGIGAEGISKPTNVGTLFRTAHAFGASFIFTVNAQYARKAGAKTDTSDAPGHVPLYSFPDVASMQLPQGCRLVGVELTEDAIELPSFRHPTSAAYILGPERSSLSPALVERCEFVVKIPMRFCVNLGVAGSIVMYDRLLSLGRFPQRPVKAGGPTEELKPHVHGGPILRHLWARKTK